MRKMTGVFKVTDEDRIVIGMLNGCTHIYYESLIDYQWKRTDGEVLLPKGMAVYMTGEDDAKDHGSAGAAGVGVEGATQFDQGKTRRRGDVL